MRIKKLFESGVRNKAEIARKIGYGGAIEQGIERVKEGLERLGLETPSNKLLSSPETKGL